VNTAQLRLIFLAAWTVWTLFVLRDFILGKATLTDLVKAKRSEQPRRFWVYMTINAVTLLMGWLALIFWTER
jgi:hypothetical protein